MVHLDTNTIRSIIEIGTTVMLSLSTSICILFVYFYTRLINQKFGNTDY
ncbi:hypothetical protein SAMN04515674_102163 [Pseudarcicella hirudinis]|uniref:Uncharacterized protein n=1 Tax=Pseudarcicella hirudinis TaxID=1079859 RepID=A0A1I5NXD8_9BACT|nr:hypothetical protein SAMN04515674_102163 [Pseudarcicella hirudinis]